MSELQDHLIISRGQWDADATPERIQDAIDRFYAWYDRLLAEGVILRGSRLKVEGRVVNRQRVLDGPFAEAKEVVGGYWFIRAASLDAAASIAAQNPCLEFGLSMEVRPLEGERASAWVKASETPGG